ncbi:hypothetical protein MGMO_167c00020 [Methyloglobulus morosus KoM1]|uniref:Uncharacterized protein n=1 Tax=Methyloglobulus morosus KoM1 TaxID=1116472 RepID=V5DIY8_9GAMM|nr:hypothetical protein MGMO_167c00020 [Methyloglobulus morosus KoM1]
MQGNRKGDYLLLQMLTRVLNGELEQSFREWHPTFRSANNYILLKFSPGFASSPPFVKPILSSPFVDGG